MKRNIAPEEYYHVYNRGNNKEDIFLDKRDYVRFVFLILYFQSSLSFHQIGRFITNFIKKNFFNISEKDVKKILENKYVNIINFTIMPNHFHLTIKNIGEDGVSKYMQKVLNAYSKYFNKKYGRSGHVFQGPYQITHVENNNQLLYLSAYIHKNPGEIKGWKGKEYKYPWSSFQDYVNENRWGKLLENDIILSQFKNKKEYKDFVEESGAKEDVEDLL